ncbi:MAG: amidase [Alphaproteobacteria bacterium]|nr:amidase [Alphaproteobacteria bacterium]
MDISTLTAAQLGRAMRDKKLDPVQVTEHFLDRIATHADQSIFITVTADRARQEAKASAARYAKGHPLGPLDGVPVAWKDLVDVRGVTTTCVSEIFRTRAPADDDAPIVKNCAAAGMVVLGKVNLTEFAFSGLGLNPHYGTPINPHSTDSPRAPGGSSSGSAVAVAAGLAPIAIGTDTGGSVRIPAAFNGLVGYKSSQGHISKERVQPLSLTLDTIGPLGKSVEDCVLMERALCRQLVVVPRPAGLADLKLVVPENLVFEEAQDAVVANFEAMLSRLSAAGVAIERRRFDVFDAMLESSAAHGTLATAEAFYNLGRYVDGPEGGKIDRRVVSRIERGRSQTAADYIAIMEARRTLNRKLGTEMEGPTFLAMPTVAITAPEIAPLEADDDVFHATNLTALRNTMLGNYFDLPGFTVPSGVDGQGLPTGILFNAFTGQDELLMCYMQSMQQAMQRS